MLNFMVLLYIRKCVFICGILVRHAMVVSFIVMIVPWGTIPMGSPVFRAELRINILVNVA